MNWEVKRLASTASTNADLAALARKGEAREGLVLVAERQTAGRGRQGRSWFSMPGRCLCFSLLLRPKVAPPLAATMPLAIGSAVADTIAPLLAPAKVAVKWPNDILVDGRKICGILCEMGATAEAVDYIVAGIGLNVNLDAADLPDELAAQATSMSLAAGRKFDLKRLLDALLASLGETYGRWQEHGLEAVRTQLDARDALRGRHVTIRLAGPPLSGTCEGIAASGALLLRLGDGTLREVFSGEAVETRAKREI